MRKAINPRLVFSWQCAACGELNLISDTRDEESDKARNAIAEESGCDPSELCVVNSIVKCQSCSEEHEIPYTPVEE
jgi:hypothetical protein